MKSFAKLVALAALACAGAAWGLPDLVISKITLATNVVYPGDKLDVSSWTKNNGDATGWWKYCDVYYYVGRTTNVASATFFGSGVTPNYNEVNGIDKGEEEKDDQTWKVPTNQAPGTYYIICKADAEREIDESNENNNVSAVKVTVKGIPSFTNVTWSGLRYVSDGDTAVAYGECVNIPAGSWVTVKLYEDDVAGDDLIHTWSVRTQQGSNCVYFAKTWAAAWTNDASGDPEYYFTCTYTADGKTAEGNSGETDGTYLHVSAPEARMTPSPVKGDFYYDNDSGNGSSVTGPSSGTAPLTDDRIPIILVHGMSGDAKPKTLNYWYGWMNADPGGTLGYFNQAPMSNMFRVYRYVYDSTDYISTNAAKFASFVTNFCAQHSEFNERQVVVMAHSMGGLVSRYAMNTNPDFAARVHRLVTLGSPHQGSQGANPTWIKYSGPDDDSWFISGIYNTFKLHNNTAGCFDLAWYNLDQIPTEALTESAIQGMSDTYQVDLLRKSLQNPFCGWTGMKTTATHDYKMVMFGGSSTNQISDYLSKDWPDEPSGEVKTDHLGLWVATKIFRSMSYRDGTGVGDNDGLVPVNSALLTDANRHPKTAKINLNETEGQQVDHASYLDVPVTMDSVRTRLLTIVRGYCEASSDLTSAEAATIAANARWRLIDPNTDETPPWQKSGVRLPALTPGVQYTVEFKEVSGFNKPANVRVTAASATTKIVRGTYTKTAAVNHAPTSLSLSNASVDENAPSGTVVGTLSATDPDSGDTLSFSLVSGDGDTGNSCFTIVGTQLKTTVPFDYEEYPTHYCRIRVTDSATNHLYLEQEFTIAVNNLPDTPAEQSGDAWLKLSWDPVADATAYRVDVTACGIATEVQALPEKSLYTNSFKNGQNWKYILPEGAATPTSTAGSVRKAPAWKHYSNATDNVDFDAHFLIGTNNIGLQTAALSLNGATTATLSFTNGAWNGGGELNRSLLRASYRLDGGAWAVLGESQPTSTADYGDVSFSETFGVAGASTVEFKLEAPNACKVGNYLRGTYVLAASVTLTGTAGEYGTGCSLPGYPVETTETSLRVSGLPVDATYWYTVEALVDGTWTAAASGAAQTSDGYLAPPQNLVATDVASDRFTLSWDTVSGADGYIVQVTDLTAGGTPTTLATIPNVNLSGSANDSGWRYAASHSVVSSNWLCEMANMTNADYHGLTTKYYPGIQSPVMDLSGYTNAFVQFTMRRRGVSGTNSTTAWLYWKTADTGWTRAPDGVSTNVDAIYNGRFLTIPVPAAAMAPGAVIEIRSDDATGTNIWSGVGVGIRNLTFHATPVGGPDYEAEGTREELEVTTNSLVLNLKPETKYWFRVQAVDNDWNLSEWSDGQTMTTSNTAPYELSLMLDDEREIIEENLPAGTMVGLLYATDDEGDALSYELVAGEGDTDNAFFLIDGEWLLLAATLDYEASPTRTFRVRATDTGGLWTEQSFTVAVGDVEEIDRSVQVEPMISLAAGGGFQLGWDGINGVRKYEVFIATNLADQPLFRYSTTVTNENDAQKLVLDDDSDGPVKFWLIQPVFE